SNIPTRDGDTGVGFQPELESVRDRQSLAGSHMATTQNEQAREKAVPNTFFLVRIISFMGRCSQAKEGKRDRENGFCLHRRKWVTILFAESWMALKLNLKNLDFAPNLSRLAPAPAPLAPRRVVLV